MTVEALKQVFIKLGANEMQAQKASMQLMKKADQIAKDRGISSEEALKELLSKIIRAQ
jgi:hypothetical protein